MIHRGIAASESELYVEGRCLKYFALCGPKEHRCRRLCFQDGVGFWSRCAARRRLPQQNLKVGLRACGRGLLSPVHHTHCTRHRSVPIVVL